MGLPKIDLPLFETKLLSTGKKKIKYRPFTVKEEKILLIAQESDEIEQVILAIKQIIGNCCQDVDVDELPMFDLEYLLLQIRGKSVNNVISFQITDPDTEKPVMLELDIDEIAITKPEGHNPEIPLGEDSYLVMRYPKLDEVTQFLNPEQDQARNIYDVMLSCIDTVAEGDTVHKLSDFSDEEVLDVFNCFCSKRVNKLRNFFI